jgi:hypothetical protein
MSIRGVQVWFQNRRAKEKALALKISSSRKSTATPKLGPNSPSEEGESLQNDSPNSSTDLELGPESPPDSHHCSRSASHPPDFVPALSRPIPHHRLSLDSSNTSWHSPSPEESAFITQPADFEVADLGLLHYRRGSLPAYTHYGGPPSLDDFDSLIRRRSVDMSLHQLAVHPYAQVARAKNGALYAAHGPTFHAPYGHHPRQFPGRSFNVAGQATGASSSVQSPYHAVRATIPGQPHVISTRTVGSPIPGPLPSPGFSFGAADSSSLPSPSERDSPDSISGLPSFAFPRHEERDAEDDATSSSSLSRFGSIASESSNTSGYYSDVGSCVAEPVYDPDGRRASCGSGPFLELLSGLDVNGARDARPHGTSIHPPDESDGHPTSTYPSPTPTVSPGGSPHVQDGASSSLPISTSSELAFALQTHEALDGGTDPYADVATSPSTDAGRVSYFYGTLATGEADAGYPQSSSSSSSGSSMSLPMMEYGEKYPFEMPAAGPYQAMPAYAPAADAGQYTPESTYCRAEEQGRGGQLHGMAFAPAAEYGAYTADTALEAFHPYT